MLFITNTVYCFKNNLHQGFLCCITFFYYYYFRKILHLRCLWLSWQGGSKVTCCRCQQPMMRYCCGAHCTNTCILSNFSTLELNDRFRGTELLSRCIHSSIFGKSAGFFTCPHQLRIYSLVARPITYR